ncbi:hypothetical protein [Paenibacillus apiarius]|nr:hypothetical protein [Paenibacillus apiarius]
MTKPKRSAAFCGGRSFGEPLSVDFETGEERQEGKRGLKGQIF